MATVHANKILTKFMLLLSGHYHCVKVSSNSETVRGMGLWEFSGALRELMLNSWKLNIFKIIDARISFYCNNLDLLPPKPKFTFRHLNRVILFWPRQIRLLTMLWSFEKDTILTP